MKLLLSCGLVCTFATAQTYTASPIDNTASSTSQNIPIAGNSTSWDEARSQFMWLAPFLPPAGGLINAIEFVPVGTYVMPYERFEIWMDHTTNATLSTTFANNLTAPQLVFAQSPGTVSFTSGVWTPITLQTPFAYNGVDNLVIEVRKKIDRPLNPPTVTVSTRILVWPRRTDLTVPIWAYGTYGSGAVDAAVATTTYNTQILMRLQWIAPATMTINSTRDVTGNANRSYFHIGATATMTTHGSPNDFHIDIADFALSPVPVSFPGVGGDLWLSPALIVYSSGFLDASGNGSSTLTIPNDPFLVGFHLYFQGGTLGTSVNFTNVVDAPIAAY